MNELLMDNENAVYYVIKVNGVEISTRFTERMVAEMAKNNLPNEQKLIAEVITVTADGKQMLLG